MSAVAAVVLAGAGVVVVPLATAAIQSSDPAPSDIALLAGVIQLVNKAYVHPIASDELLVVVAISAWIIGMTH